MKVVLEPEDGLCISSGSGSDANSEIREHVPESREGIASTVYLRFSIIPLQSGDYRIKVARHCHYSITMDGACWKLLQVLNLFLNAGQDVW